MTSTKLKKVLSRNRLVNPKQLEESMKLSRELRDVRARKFNYRIAPPYATRFRISAGGKYACEHAGIRTVR